MMARCIILRVKFNEIVYDGKMYHTSSEVQNIIDSLQVKLIKSSKDVKIDIINPQTKKPFKSLKHVQRGLNNLLKMYNNNVKLLKAMQDFNNE